MMDYDFDMPKFLGRDLRCAWKNREERLAAYADYTLARVRENSVPGSNGCIEFMGNIKHKYGLVSITIDGRHQSVPAHRAVYMATNGLWDLPRSIHIRHKCDNPRCVNIQHLEPGTAKDNMRDAIEGGRRRPGLMKYKLHTRQRIHDDDTIRAIRAATGKQKWIAEEYGVSIGYVSKIRNGKAKTLV